MKIKATKKNEREIVHVELVDEKNTEAMLSIGIEKGGRAQYQAHGTAPALLSALTLMIGHTVGNIGDEFGMPADAKEGLLELVCEKAKVAMKHKDAETDKEEADDEDDDMPSDLKDALKLLKKLAKEIGEL